MQIPNPFSSRDLTGNKAFREVVRINYRGTDICLLRVGIKGETGPRQTLRKMMWPARLAPGQGLLRLPEAEESLELTLPRPLVIRDTALSGLILKFGLQTCDNIFCCWELSVSSTFLIQPQ